MARRFLTTLTLIGIVLAGSASLGWPAGARSGADTPTPTPTPSAYAGLQARPIKALAPDRVAGLLAGRGLSYALAAELNHYPGPAHVLELADALDLTPEQAEATRALAAEVAAAAPPLGRRLVEIETELDRAFAEVRMTEAELNRLTAESAEVEGRLRAVHLRAHVAQRALLTSDQIARYDHLRGYTAPGGHQPHQHHGR